MKIFRAALIFAVAYTALAHGQTQPNPNHLRTLFVGGLKANSGAVPIYAGGAAPFVLGSSGSSAADVNMYFRKRCHVAVTAPTPEAADFVLTPNYKQWDLVDKTGKVVFTTKAFREVNAAKDVCDYFKTHP
jgi:hypothetical protein